MGDGKGNWKRSSERIEEIYWPHKNVVRDLTRAGFKLLRLFDFTDPRSAPSPTKAPDGLRTIYLAQKKGNPTKSFSAESPAVSCFSARPRSK
jgi:hypothetical protein